MDAECIFCYPISVNKTFDQRVSAALAALTENGSKTSTCAKRAHNIYKQAYNSLTPEQIRTFNVPFMTSRHMARHFDIYDTSAETTSKRIADRHESDLNEFGQNPQYKVVQTDAGPMPNVKLLENLVKLGKEVVGMRANLNSRRPSQIGKVK